MDSQIDCPRCGRHKAEVVVSIGPTVAVDATQCTACGQVVCAEGNAQLLRLLHIPRHKEKRSEPTS